jgi:3-deoxy-manno-octulosonate cytidylyltransferase (CMP-KDO synthetase)
MKITGIIPARYASSRFPGKPLTLIDGRPMIQHVYEQCKKSEYLSDVIIATDDERIAEAIEKFHGKYMMTSPCQPTGTDRCAEVCSKIETDAVINIQGDEPKIHPAQIDQVAKMLMNEAPICTLARKISQEEAQDSNIVKLVKNIFNQALYFSRLSIPFNSTENYLQHVGIYGYQREILLEITKLPESKLELSEKLEQLRWLEHGYQIFIDITEHENISIDRIEDLKKLIS